MVLEKIFFGAIAVLIVWVMLPHAKRGEFLAPNPLPPGSWTLQYDPSEYAQASASPSQGYGFRRFDFWNGTTQDSRPATRKDFQLRY